MSVAVLINSTHNPLAGCSSSLQANIKNFKTKVSTETSVKVKIGIN